MTKDMHERAEQCRKSFKKFKDEYSPTKSNNQSTENFNTDETLVQLRKGAPNQTSQLLPNLKPIYSPSRKSSDKKAALERLIGKLKKK